MAMGAKASSKWKNFISLWERNSGALAASGQLDFEAMCRVFVDQNVISRDAAKEIYLALKKHFPEMSIQVACWTVKDRQGKQPNFQIGWNPPYEKGGSSSGPDTPTDDVPF